MANFFYLIIAVVTVFPGTVWSASASLIKLPNVLRDKKFYGYVIWEVKAGTIFPCAQICAQMPLCQSVGYIADLKKCELYGDKPGNLRNCPGDIFILADNIPKDLAGNCADHKCAGDQFCVTDSNSGYRCIPRNLHN